MKVRTSAREISERRVRCRRRRRDKLRTRDPHREGDRLRMAAMINITSFSASFPKLGWKINSSAIERSERCELHLHSALNHLATRGGRVNAKAVSSLAISAFLHEMVHGEFTYVVHYISATWRTTLRAGGASWAATRPPTSARSRAPSSRCIWGYRGVPCRQSWIRWEPSIRSTD